MQGYFCIKSVVKRHWDYDDNGTAARIRREPKPSSALARVKKNKNKSILATGHGGP
jgi:hypothetical protein